MSTDRTPLRWPSAWKDASCLELLQGTPINFLLLEPRPEVEKVIARARQGGFEVAGANSLPGEVTVTDGKWPGILLTRGGQQDEAAAGPTGDPWVDSNGWKVRLAAALHRGKEIWVDATPAEPRLSAEAYVMAVADAGAYGGRWIISLDDQLAAAIAARKSEALVTWKKLTATSAFFAAHKDWTTLPPRAVLGIISDYAGQNEFFSNELLNLVARTNQQYRIILRGEAEPAHFAGLRAVLYADGEPPSPDLRKQVLAFVEDGGILITGPKWGEIPGTPVPLENYGGYSTRLVAKGRIAVSAEDLADPYLAAHDATVLLSHRYDVLRFWNGGALGSYYTFSPDGKRAVLQMLFYASPWPEGSPTSLWIAGRYRSARLWRLDQSGPQNLEMEVQKDGVEVHLPSVAQYGALELET